MARNTGQSYPITQEWRARVGRELLRRDWFQAQLARALGCAAGTITHLLHGEVKGSPYVPAIHVLFGWLPPPAAGSEASEEALQILAGLDELGRARWFERGRALLDEQKQRQALDARR